MAQWRPCPRPPGTCVLQGQLPRCGFGRTQLLGTESKSRFRCMLSLNFGPFSGINSFSVSNLERREEGALIIYPSFMPSVRPSVRRAAALRRRVGLFLLRRASRSLARSASHVSFVRGARGGEGGRQSGRAAHSSSLRFPDLVTFPLTLSLYLVLFPLLNNMF